MLNRPPLWGIKIHAREGKPVWLKRGKVPKLYFDKDAAEELVELLLENPLADAAYEVAQYELEEA